MKILVVYDKTKIVSVIEALEGGVTHYQNGRMSFVGTKQDALDFFNMKGFDTSKIAEFESINPEQ